MLLADTWSPAYTVDPAVVVRILVVGESLIDEIVGDDGSVVRRVGGSPLNVAVALGRLGHKVEFLTALGDDAAGAQIRAHVKTSGVALLAAPSAATATAWADTRAGHGIDYRFDITWDLSHAPATAPPDWLHVGSLGTVLQPGASHVRALLEQHVGLCPISFDPNCRPSLTPDADLAGVEDLVRCCDLVKLSDEDAEHLLPGLPVEQVLARWRTLGPRLVVLTRGARGALAFGEELTSITAAPGDPVVDTVGAGDAFMAGLIATRGTSYDLASRLASVTVGRVGADPPWAHELLVREAD